MRVKYALLLLFLPIVAQAQASLEQQFPEGGEPTQPTSRAKEHYKAPGRDESVSASWWPRPFLFSGPSLLGNGYQTFSANLGGGFLLHTRRLQGDFETYYMNAKKTNDGTIGNKKGHERFLSGRLSYPWRKGLYFGGGAQWSETSTTNYTKKSWRPTFGVGGDYFASGGGNCRWQLFYITKGSDKSNAVQGPEFQLWIPSPVSKSHFFYRQTLGVYEFHTTVTDPKDLKLAASQIGQRSSAAFLDFTVGWRF